MFLLRADMLPRALHEFTAADFFTTYKNINSLKACILKIYPNNHICYIRHILFFSKMCRRCFKKSFTLFFMFWLNIFNRTIKKGGSAHASMVDYNLGFSLSLWYMQHLSTPAR